MVGVKKNFLSGVPGRLGVGWPKPWEQPEGCPPGSEKGEESRAELPTPRRKEKRRRREGG